MIFIVLNILPTQVVGEGYVSRRRDVNSHLFGVLTDKARFPSARWDSRKVTIGGVPTYGTYS